MNHSEYIKRREEITSSIQHWTAEYIASEMSEVAYRELMIAKNEAIDALVLAVIGRCDGGHSDWEVQNQCDIENDLRTDQRSIVKGGE